MHGKRGNGNGNGKRGQSPFSKRAKRGQSPFSAVGLRALPAVVLARRATCAACGACSPRRPSRNSAPSRAPAGRTRARASAAGSMHPPYTPAPPASRRLSCLYVSSLFTSEKWRLSPFPKNGDCPHFRKMATVPISPFPPFPMSPKPGDQPYSRGRGRRGQRGS